MKHILRLPAALAAVLISAATAQAQTDPIKFGKIDPADLTAAPFAGDSAAAAVVLCDFGRTSIQFVVNDYQLISERVTRIKILKKAGFENATVQVPLYHHDTRAEKISGLRGTTYNLVGGKAVPTKLDGGNVFVEELTPNVRVRKFTLPDVREGSVIEYTYTVTSDFFFNFQDWTFQRDIPVRWSEFRAIIPEHFKYQMLMQGYHALALNSETEGNMPVPVSSASGFSPTSVENVRTTNYHWAMKDVPAFRDEPYMTTSEDYVDRISFQLAGLQFPNQPYQNVAGTWAKIDLELLNSDNFGQQLGHAGFLKDQLKALVAKYPDQASRTAAVRQLVMGAVRYDGATSLYSTGPLRKAYDAHHGNAADVNLLLIAALREAGIPANPLLLSTRSHGRVNQAQPLLERFNYVAGHVALADGKDLLLDATEPLLPCGVLPARCLNGAGRLIMKNSADGRWVELTPSQRYVHYQQINLALDAQGGISGKVHEEHGGYAGADARRELASLGEKKYASEMARPHSSWTMPKFAVAERENVDKPLSLDYEFTQASENDASVGTFYLSPLREFTSEQNPFRHDDRLFPVDFGAPKEETRMITLTLPAGYELAELPKPAVMELPDGGGRFLYSVAATAPGVVQLTSRLSLRKPSYAAAEYANLREFYRLMLEKQGEKLVIKKKA